MGSLADLYSSIPLEVNNREIRVLRLLPSRQDDPVKLGLHQMSLNDNSPYLVLSYCWGPQTDLQVVQVEDHPFQISKHLHACLVKLRQKDQPLSIWIDAICINQASNPEKNTQVPLMGDIYKGASEVFIWLGESTPGLDLIFTTIRRVAEHKINIDPARVEQIAEELLGASPEATDAAISDFVGLPWFYRTWIMQELALPRSAPMLICGSHRAVWSDVERFLDVASSIIEKAHLYSELSLPVWKNLYHNLHDFIRVFNHLSEMRTCFEKQVAFDTGLPLSALIAFSQFSTATDPRDKIYGLMGMANAKAKLSITIDYSKPVKDLFEEASRYLIFSENQLSLITTQMANLEQLSVDSNFEDHTIFRVRNQANVKSSWIRDFACVHDNKHRYTPLSKPVEARGLRYDASYRTSPTTLGHQRKGVLKIIGTYLDAVKECTSAWALGSEERQWYINLNGLLDVFFRAGKAPAAEQQTIRPAAAEGLTEQSDTRSISKVARMEKELEEQKKRDIDGQIGEHPWHLLYHPLRGPVKPIRQAIWRTLIGDKVSTESNEQAPETYELFFDMFLSIGQGASTVGLTKGPARVFGDEWERHWDIWRLRYQNMLHRRSAFSTENGWIGLGPDWMQPGDIAVILSGGDLPTILRPIREGFLIVGECYIEGAMYGDFLMASSTADARGDLAVPCQLFSIY